MIGGALRHDGVFSAQTVEFVEQRLGERQVVGNGEVVILQTEFEGAEQILAWQVMGVTGARAFVPAGENDGVQVGMRFGVANGVNDGFANAGAVDDELFPI